MVGNDTSAHVPTQNECSMEKNFILCYHKYSIMREVDATEVDSINQGHSINTLQDSEVTVT